MSVAALSLLAGCGGMQRKEDAAPLSKDERKRAKMGKLFGDEALTFRSDRKKSASETVGIGVNSYLWHATLDVLKDLPLASADPFGGVILTDWYADSSAPQERIKLNVTILDRALRADALRVSVFRQIMQNGLWVDQPVDQKTSIDIENAILAKARQLKINSGK